MRCVFVEPALIALGITGLLAGQPASAQEAKPYDLARCIAEAVTNAPELRAAADENAAAEAAAAQARARRWPSLSLAAEASYVSEVNELELPSAPPRTIRFGDNDSYGVTAGLEVPLYTGGALAATERARRVDALATVYDGAADSLRIVRDVRAQFFLALGTQAEFEAAEVAVQRLQRHLNELSGRIEAGAASEEDRLQSRSRLSAAQQRRAAALERRDVASLELGRALGQPGLTVRPEGQLEQTLLGVSPGGSPADAVSARPELHALTLRQQASEARRRAARGSLLPSVSAIGQLHYAKPGVRIIDNEWMDWASAGVQLKWTLWDAGERSAQVHQLAATTRVLAHRHTVLERRLRGALAVALAQVASRRDQIHRAELRVEFDRQRLGLVEGRYRQGLGTESELLDAQDDLAESETALAATQAQLRLAEVDYLYAVAR
jgi:outer membrane protein TolC